MDLGHSNKKLCLLYCLLCHAMTPITLNVRGKWKANDRKQEYIG